MLTAALALPTTAHAQIEPTADVSKIPALESGMLVSYPSLDVQLDSAGLLARLSPM